MQKQIPFSCREVDPRIKNIISKYLDKTQMSTLFYKGKTKTNQLANKKLGKFKFSYKEFKEDDKFTFILKISASEISGIIRNDSVCTEQLIDKQTLLFDSSFGFNDEIAKQLKKDIKTFFKRFQTLNKPCYEEED